METSRNLKGDLKKELKQEVKQELGACSTPPRCVSDSPLRFQFKSVFDTHEDIIGYEYPHIFW